GGLLQPPARPRGHPPRRKAVNSGSCLFPPRTRPYPVCFPDPARLASKDAPMARSGLVLPFCAGLLLVISQPGRAIDPLTIDADSAFKSSLLVQRAMERANFALFQQRDAKTAVQILEDNLARINGNAAYLRLLRDAYRAYIQDLRVARRHELAEKYQQRLAILDPDARPKGQGGIQD